MQYDENPCLYCEVLLAEKEKLICPYCEKMKEYESAHDDYWKLLWSMPMSNDTDSCRSIDQPGREKAAYKHQMRWGSNAVYRKQ